MERIMRPTKIDVLRETSNVLNSIHLPEGEGFGGEKFYARVHLPEGYRILISSNPYRGDKPNANQLQVELQKLNGDAYDVIGQSFISRNDIDNLAAFFNMFSTQ